VSIFCKRFVKYILFPYLVVAFSSAWSAEPEGQALFEKRCVACHKLPDPGQPPEVGWEKQLDLMAPLAQLKKGQKQEVLTYILSHARDSSMEAALDEDRLLFEEKCSRCHNLERVLLSQLSGDDLRHVVNRMQNRSGTDWLSNLEVETVLAYLSDALREAPSVQIADNASPEQIFVARCSACHTLERVFSSMAEDADDSKLWSHTVSRMRSKAPQWMSDSDASQILEYLRSVNPEK
jgi:mono/diheme cytochrome c family protein